MSLEERFTEELRLLRELCDEVVERHPKLAPVLKGSDPDVERLFQGTALATAALRGKIEDDFPQFINQLVYNLYPQRLKPFPSATIVAFTPKPSLRQPQIIPAGTQLASVPVDGTSCRFVTTSDVEIHPLILKEAAFSRPAGKAPTLDLHLQLQQLRLIDWRVTKLRLYIAGQYREAANLYLLLMRYLKRITITPRDGGKAMVLPPGYLKPAGLADEDTLLPASPEHPFAGRQLQEYFIMPEKFLFVDLFGWEGWHDRGTGSAFHVSFEFVPFPSVSTPSAITSDTFTLFATPAVNLFQQKAQRVCLDDRNGPYLVQPQDNSGDCHIHSIDSVHLCAKGTLKQRKYHCCTSSDFGKNSQCTYKVIYRRNAMERESEVLLQLPTPNKTVSAEDDRMDIDVTCTNGTLPMRLGLGDVRIPTDTSPECADFKNVTSVTAHSLPELGGNALWQFYSLLQMHPATFKGRDRLIAVLRQLVPELSPDQERAASALRRIAGIVEITARDADRMMGPYAARGREIVMRLDSDTFTCPGDLYLFGSLLEQFLGCYASETGFTMLKIEESGVAAS